MEKIVRLEVWLKWWSACFVKCEALSSNISPTKKKKTCHNYELIQISIIDKMIYEQVCANKFYNLYEMDKFFKTYNL
jgi:hypothetical protein